MTATRADSISPERLNAERARLVRLCYRFTGSLDAAEDLAQETIYEALRNMHKLHDPSGYARWLSAIAHNVCRRWNERRGRELAGLLPSERKDDASGDEESDELDLPDEDYDLDVELDPRELVRLLDRALNLLPAESREVLIAHYFHDSPYAEIALRLGLTGPTVAKRLERGRLRLKRVLSTTLIHEAVGQGLVTDRLFDDWDETPIWCPSCGRRRLYGKRVPGGRIWLICRPCIIPVNLYATVPLLRRPQLQRHLPAQPGRVRPLPRQRYGRLDGALLPVQPARPLSPDDRAVRKRGTPLPAPRVRYLPDRLRPVRRVVAPYGVARRTAVPPGPSPPPLPAGPGGRGKRRAGAGHPGGKHDQPGAPGGRLPARYLRTDPGGNAAGR